MKKTLENMKQLKNKPTKQNPSFERLDFERLKHLKTKKYFELYDLESEFKDINFFIIKGKKNIGKTYAMLQKMSDISAGGGKFVYMRITDGELKNVAKEWNSDPKNPFLVKAGRIYSKKTNQDVGVMVHLKNLQKFRSLQFNDYVGVFFDEYIAFSDSVYGSGEHSDLNLAINFIRFIMDVQRAKPNVKVYCFGNNDLIVDLFTKYFKLDIYASLQLDRFNKVLFVNLGDLYVGSNQTLANGLAYYNQFLQAYLSENATMIDISKLINYDSLNQGVVVYYFMLRGVVYKYVNLLETNQQQVRISKYSIISDASGEPLIPKIPIVALTSTDYLINNKSVLWQLEQLQLVALGWMNLIKKNKLKFTDKTTERTILTWISGNYYNNF